MPAAQSAILPDHILAAVLTLAKQELARRDPNLKRLDFRSHDFQLQEIFSELQKAKRYPILDAFVFSDSGPEPYSPALSESVSRLQLSGLIGRENPDYEVVFLRPAADQFYDEVLSAELGAPEIQKQLTEIASQFLHRVGKI
jgi:hypothetical protein